jgi:hypothetical protein
MTGAKAATASAVSSTATPKGARRAAAARRKMTQRRARGDRASAGLALERRARRRLVELVDIAVGVGPAAPLVADHLEVLAIAVRDQRGGVDQLDLHGDPGLAELGLDHLRFLHIDRDIVRRHREGEAARLAALGELGLDPGEVALGGGGAPSSRGSLRQVLGVAGWRGV